MEIYTSAVYLSLFVLVSQIFRSAITAEMTHSSKTDPPVLIVDGYKTLEDPLKYVLISEDDIASKVFSKDGDDYTVKTIVNISEIILSCRAQYPIFWTMEGVKSTNMDGTRTHSVAVFSDDFEEANWTNIQVTEFISYLQLSNDVSSQTGLYVCKSIEDEKIRRSVYMFFPGIAEDAKILIGSDGNEQSVGVNGLNEVTIPCRVSKKEASVSLYKEEGNGNWSSLETKPTYDPKEGFIVHNAEKDKLIGQYKCTVVAPPAPTEELIVNVVENLFQDTKFPTRNESFGERGQWMLTGYRDSLACCSNSSASPAPQFYVKLCETNPDCIMKSLTFSNLLGQGIKLSSKKHGFELTTTQIRTKGCIVTTTYGFHLPFLMKCKGDGVDFSGKYASELDLADPDNIVFVPMDSAQYSVNTAIRVTVKKWGNMTTGRRSMRGPQLTEINLKETSLYSGEQFVMDCCGMHYYHASGRMQRIVWKNGTTMLLPTADKERYDPERKPYAEDFCYQYVYEEDNEEYLITAHENMSHFECIVPRWNDRKPGVIIIPLDIKVPKEPVFITQEEVENITYHENQLGVLQLDCKLSAADPPPQMVWKKEGYEINQTDLYWSEVTQSSDRKNRLGSSLLFMRATKEIEGEYECTAENRMGVVQKHFFVTVLRRSYLDYWVALVVFGGFFAIIICCALRISTLEKRTSPKQSKAQTFTPACDHPSKDD